MRVATAWAASQGSEAHFFLVDPERFTQGQRDAKLTSDDCGTTQHYLLLDEFYRTALWLGGRTPLWWLVPDYEEHRYDDYVATLLAKRFVRRRRVLDLGHLSRAAVRVRRRRPVAAVQGHRLAVQVAVQAAAGGGLCQPVPAAALLRPWLSSRPSIMVAPTRRARSVYRRLSRHRTLPVRARCSGAAGARPTLPVPEDQPTAESSTGQPQQELATQPARTPDPRLALGRAAVRSARQSQPVEGAPVSQNAARWSTN